MPKEAIPSSTVSAFTEPGKAGSEVAEHASLEPEAVSTVPAPITSLDGESSVLVVALERLAHVRVLFSVKDAPLTVEAEPKASAQAEDLAAAAQAVAPVEETKVEEAKAEENSPISASAPAVEDTVSPDAKEIDGEDTPAVPTPATEPTAVKDEEVTPEEAATEPIHIIEDLGQPPHLHPPAHRHWLTTSPVCLPQMTAL